MPIERSKLNRLLAGFVGAPLAVGAFALSCVLDGEQRGRTVLNEAAAGLHRVALSADREKSWRFVSDALLSAFLS